MNWQILLFVSILATSSMVLLSRVIMKESKIDPISYSIIFQLIAGFFILFFAILNGFKMPVFQTNLINFILMPFLWAGANVFIFKALKKIEASQYTILFTTRAFWVILIAVLFLGESFSIKQGIGTLLILAGVIIISLEKKSKILRFGVGQLYALLGAMMFGLGLANDSFIVARNDVPSYFSFAFIIPALFTFIIYPSSFKDIRSLFKINMITKVSLLSLLAAISALTYFFAFKDGNNAGQLASVNQLSAVITVLLSIIILRERSGVMRKILAAFVSFIGVILVI